MSIIVSTQKLNDFLVSDEVVELIRQHHYLPMACKKGTVDHIRDMSDNVKLCILKEIVDYYIYDLERTNNF